MGTIPASENVFPLVELAEGAAPSTPASGQVRLYAKSAGTLYSKDDAGAETDYAAGASGVAAHIADTTAAHAASAISFSPTGTVAATDVQAAIAEVASEAAAGGISATIADAKGDLIAATANDTVARLAVGSNDLALVASSGDTAGLKWGRAVGTILAAICYGNSTDTKTTTSTSMVDADATNLAVAFTAPASGIVLVRLTAVGSGDVGGGSGGLVGDIYSWGLRESTTDIAGPSIATRLPVSGATANLYASYSICYKLTGLTPGSSHTYKWAHKVSNSRCTGAISTQATAPATMEVIAL